MYLLVKAVDIRGDAGEDAFYIAFAFGCENIDSLLQASAERFPCFCFYRFFIQGFDGLSDAGEIVQLFLRGIQVGLKRLQPVSQISLQLLRLNQCPFFITLPKLINGFLNR